MRTLVRKNRICRKKNRKKKAFTKNLHTPLRRSLFYEPEFQSTTPTNTNNTQTFHTQTHDHHTPFSTPTHTHQHTNTHHTHTTNTQQHHHTHTTNTQQHQHQHLSALSFSIKPTTTTSPSSSLELTSSSNLLQLAHAFSHCWTWSSELLIELPPQPLMSKTRSSLRYFTLSISCCTNQ